MPATSTASSRALLQIAIAAMPKMTTTRGNLERIAAPAIHRMDGCQQPLIIPNRHSRLPARMPAGLHRLPYEWCVQGNANSLCWLSPGSGLSCWIIWDNLRSVMRQRLLQVQRARYRFATKAVLHHPFTYPSPFYTHNPNNTPHLFPHPVPVPIPPPT